LTFTVQAVAKNIPTKKIAKTLEMCEYFALNPIYQATFQSTNPVFRAVITFT